MYDCYLTFRSITHAQKGSNLLTEAGIRHRMLRTPKTLSAQGCGYALMLLAVLAFFSGQGAFIYEGF